jgi:hypothetical protein
MSLCGDRVTRAGSGGGLAVMKAAAPALTGLALLAALGGFAVRDALTAVLHWYRRKTEAGLKARGRADTGMRRTGSLSHFGLVLSVFVLCLQLVAPGLHPPLQLGSRTGNGDLAGLIGEHALCLGVPPGSSTGEPASPAQPSEEHHDFASCCFWHCNASPPVPSVAASSVVSFDITGIAFLAPTYTVVVRARPSGAFAARAPPVGA